MASLSILLRWPYSASLESSFIACHKPHWEPRINDSLPGALVISDVYILATPNTARLSDARSTKGSDRQNGLRAAFRQHHPRRRNSQAVAAGPALLQKITCC